VDELHSLTKRPRARFAKIYSTENQQHGGDGDQNGNEIKKSENAIQEGSQTAQNSTNGIIALDDEVEPTVSRRRSTTPGKQVMHVPLVPDESTKRSCLSKSRWFCFGQERSMDWITDLFLLG
jgi:hypothetical protein